MSEARQHPFLERLRRGAMVIDGAMGTSLYETGVRHDKCFEELNVSKPDSVRKIHEGFVQAGADALETNTFGANRYRLQPHGLQDRVEEFNRRGVALAREAAGDAGVFVLGAVGPTGLLPHTITADERAGIRACFLEQCRALCGAGVDALIIETFHQSEELALAVAAALEASAGAVPVVGMVSFDERGTTSDGKRPERMVAMLDEWGVDAVGVNCATGPAGVYEMATRMLSRGLPVVAIPNAGMPQQQDGRLFYMATPEYFQMYARRLYRAGVHGVGGCCGTTPEHIKKIAAAARMLGATGGGLEAGGGMREEQASITSVAPGVTVTPLAEKGTLGAKLEASQRGQGFVVSVEVNPPPGLSLDRALDSARALRDGGVDVINVADSPRAQALMGNMALCRRIQEEVGLPSLMHVTTRDRNLLGLFAYLLAAHDMDIRNLVVITGDPPKMGDFPDATPVYDVDSVGLLRVASSLNRGYDAGGKALGSATRFLLATGAEPGAQDQERELERLRQKCEAGAELVMTQPVYDPTALDRMLGHLKAFDIPVLIGLLPLASHRNAEFLHNEVPGMQIPESIRERMRKAGAGAPGRAEGVRIAREMLEAVRDRVAGAYIMPPFGRHELALEVIDGVVR